MNSSFDTVDESITPNQDERRATYNTLYDLSCIMNKNPLLINKGKSYLNTCMDSESVGNEVDQMQPANFSNQAGKTHHFKHRLDHKYSPTNFYLFGPLGKVLPSDDLKLLMSIRSETPPPSLRQIINARKNVLGEFDLEKSEQNKGNQNNNEARQDSVELLREQYKGQIEENYKKANSANQITPKIDLLQIPLQNKNKNQQNSDLQNDHSLDNTTEEKKQHKVKPIRRVVSKTSVIDAVGGISPFSKKKPLKKSIKSQKNLEDVSSVSGADNKGQLLNQKEDSRMSLIKQIPKLEQNLSNNVANDTNIRPNHCQSQLDLQNSEKMSGLNLANANIQEGLNLTVLQKKQKSQENQIAAIKSKTQVRGILKKISAYGVLNRINFDLVENSNSMQNRQAGINKALSMNNMMIVGLGGQIADNEGFQNQHKRKQVQFQEKIIFHQYEDSPGAGPEGLSDSSNGEDSEEETQQLKNERIVEEQRDYLYNKRDIELLSQVKKPFHKFIIPPDDPVFKYEYNYLFLRDREMRKKLYTELKNIKIFNKKHNKLGFDDKVLRAHKRAFARKNTVPNFTQKPDGTKKHTRKTIVFDLENTLVKSQYKKHKLTDYDSHIYINILGTKRIRLYISYRSFVKEMLEQLRQDFELILYSTQSKDYAKQLSQLLTINSSDQFPSVFSHVISKEECIFSEELDQHISDIEILCENRNLKDIIFVTDTFTRALKHVRNIVPVKSYHGSKKDYSLVALARYLKGFVRIKDVREKIQLDFKTIDF